MKIKRFSALNFRNIERCDIEFSDGINLLYGDNAQGKTNAVEGIYLFARGKSFRASEEKELVRFGSEGFRICIEYEDKDGINSLAFFICVLCDQNPLTVYKYIDCTRQFYNNM